MFDCLSYRSSFICDCSSSPLIDEGFHDFGEEYILLNMELEIEYWILSESANKAVSCEKGCRGGDFTRWKSVDVSGVLY